MCRARARMFSTSHILYRHSVTSVIYILPPLCYWKVCSGDIGNVKKRYLVRAGLVFLIVFGLTGSGFGLSVSVPELIRAFKNAGNPFHDFFAGCTHVLHNTTMLEL